VQLQHAGNCKGNQGDGRFSDGRPTGFTGRLPIGFHASLSGTRATRGKIEGNLVATAEVHFIWRLTSEGGMGNNGIVLLDIKRDQLFQRRECVQLAQKQPAMPHRPPLDLNHGIRIADLDLSEDAVQLPQLRAQSPERFGSLRRIVSGARRRIVNP
jgi:hypothetical protein